MARSRRGSRASAGPASKDLGRARAGGQPARAGRSSSTGARRQLLKKTRGHYPAPEQALEAIRIGLETGRKAGSEAEAKLFGELVVDGRVAAAGGDLLRHHRAEEGDRHRRTRSVKPREVKKVGVLGGGLMGGGIAYVTAAPGMPVRAQGQGRRGASGRALKHVHEHPRRAGEAQALAHPARARRRSMALVTRPPTTAASRRADLVIEAVFEDLELKHAVIARSRRVTGAGRHLRVQHLVDPHHASIAEAAQAARERGRDALLLARSTRCRCSRSSRTRSTGDWVDGHLRGRRQEAGQDGDRRERRAGFYTSRILAPYMNEAAFLLAEGAAIDEHRQALVDFGFPVGPITLLDEVGIDVAHKVGADHARGVRRAHRAADGAREAGRRRPPGPQEKKGFYLYEDGEEEGGRPHRLRCCCRRAQERKLARPPSEMAERCALQMVNEAVRCLGEGILRSAARRRRRRDLRPGLPAVPRRPVPLRGQPRRRAGGAQRLRALPGQVRRALHAGAGAGAARGLGGSSIPQTPGRGDVEVRDRAYAFS